MSAYTRPAIGSVRGCRTHICHLPRSREVPPMWFMHARLVPVRPRRSVFPRVRLQSEEHKENVGGARVLACFWHIEILQPLDAFCIGDRVAEHNDVRISGIQRGDRLRPLLSRGIPQLNGQLCRILKSHREKHCIDTNHGDKRVLEGCLGFSQCVKKGTLPRRAWPDEQTLMESVAAPLLVDGRPKVAILVSKMARCCRVASNKSKRRSTALHAVARLSRLHVRGELLAARRLTDPPLEPS